MRELYEKDEAFDHFGYRQTNRLRISCSHEIEYIGSDDMIGTIAAIIFFRGLSINPFFRNISCF